MRNLLENLSKGKSALIERIGRLFFAAMIVLIFLLGHGYRNPRVENAVPEEPNTLLTSPAADDIVGFNGPLPARIRLDPDSGRISSVEFLPNAEDQSYWDQVLASGVFDKYTGKTPAEAAGLEIDAVSGATFTAAAAQETLRKRLRLAADLPAGRSHVPHVRWTDFLALGVILLNLLLLFRRGGGPRQRLAMNIINLAVLGFLSYTFLSTAQILGWAAIAPHWRISVQLLLFMAVVAAAVILGRNVYCTGICPYGCAQEIAGALGRKCRITPLKWTSRYGPYIRRFLLAGYVLALLCGCRIIQLEPFSIFTRHAPWYIILLAVVFLAVSLFLPRLWCRWFCPCGALLDFFRKTENKEVLYKKEGERKMTYERILILVLLLIVVIALFRPQARVQPPDAAAGDVPAVIAQRKSVRNYTGEPVTADELDKLVRAGFAAPSAGNRQPWEFVVVTERARLDRLAEGLQFGKMLAKAPAAIIVCGNSAEFLDDKARDMWIQDCSAATQNILLAAEGMNLGAVWLGILPLEERMKLVAETLNLPDGIIPLNVISIGRPSGMEKPKDKYKPAKVHLQQW